MASSPLSTGAPPPPLHPEYFSTCAKDILPCDVSQHEHLLKLEGAKGYYWLFAVLSSFPSLPLVPHRARAEPALTFSVIERPGRGGGGSGVLIGT